MWTYILLSLATSTAISSAAFPVRHPHKKGSTRKGEEPDSMEDEEKATSALVRGEHLDIINDENQHR